jgi:hypothetical protein
VASVSPHSPILVGLASQLAGDSGSNPGSPTGQNSAERAAWRIGYVYLVSGRLLPPGLTLVFLGQSALLCR